VDTTEKHRELARLQLAQLKVRFGDRFPAEAEGVLLERLVEIAGRMDAIRRVKLSAEDEPLLVFRPGEGKTWAI
jgi:hypothetical protein